MKSLCYAVITVRYFKIIFPFNKRARASPFMWFLDHTQRHITVGRTHLEEWSASRRDYYLTHNVQRDRHPRPRQHLKPQFQQARGRRRTS